MTAPHSAPDVPHVDERREEETDPFMGPGSTRPTSERKPGDFDRHPTTGAPYVLVDGKRRMYGRPSGFGAALDNSYGLIKWKERQILVGAAELGERFEVSEFPDRDELDGLAARCHELAGSSLSAERGTHVHSLLQFDHHTWNNHDLVSQGEALGLPAVLQMRIIEQWREFRDALGIRTIACEMTVVHDTWRLAGTLDYLDVLERPLITKLGPVAGAVIGDVKTGGLTLGRDGQPNYWVKYPVQLAAYAHGSPYDTDTNLRTEWPRVPDQLVALIYHYDLASAVNGEQVEWQAIPVDLVAGREAGDLCRTAADFGKRRDLFGTPIAAPVPPTVEQRAGEVGAPPASPADRRTALLARYQALATVDQLRFAALQIPADDLDAIEAALDECDPFNLVLEPEPVVEVQAPDDAPAVDEGGPADPDLVDQLRVAWEFLPADGEAWVKSVVARTGNLSIAQLQSQRRYLIGFALVQLAVAGWHDDELLAACLGHALTDDLATTCPLSASVLVRTVQAVCDGTYTFSVDPDGTMRLTAAPDKQKAAQAS